MVDEVGWKWRLWSPHGDVFPFSKKTDITGESRRMTRPPFARSRGYDSRCKLHDFRLIYFLVAGILCWSQAVPVFQFPLRLER